METLEQLKQKSTVQPVMTLKDTEGYWLSVCKDYGPGRIPYGITDEKQAVQALLDSIDKQDIKKVK